MTLLRTLLVTIPTACMIALLPLATPVRAEQRIVGATETVTVAESGLAFLGRVDTGAATCSVHAVDTELLGPVPVGGSPVGRQVAFTLLNEHGESRRLNARVEKIESVRTSEGKEERLCVYLTVGWQGEEKRVLVNLNDRSAMTYRLLLGRNWLENDYLVDVTRSSGTAP